MRACFGKFRKIESAKRSACQKKRENVFSWTLSFIWDKCAEIWDVVDESPFMELDAELGLIQKSPWCTAVGSDLLSDNGILQKNISPSSKSHICPFHTSDLWVDMLLLMCGHSKRFNHGLMHISEAWFCTQIQSLETHQRSLQSFSCKLV